MRLWSRLLIVAGIGVVLQGLEEGQAAVPVGGGRAQPGFKIDHSKPYAHETHAVPAGGGRAWPGFEIDLSERSVWRSHGRDAAHRHQHAGRHASTHAGTNTQPQTHRHNEAARPHWDRAAHASGR